MARVSARALLRQLLALAPLNGTFVVQTVVEADVNFSEFVEVQLENGNLLASPVLSRLPLSSNATSWPRTTIALADLGQALSMLDNAKLSYDVLNGLAPLIEHALSWRSDPAQLNVMDFLNSNNFYIDPHAKKMVHALGRNPFRTAKFLKSIKVRVQQNVQREQLVERTEYWLATRAAMAEGFTWAWSPDATRFAGRDWQAAPVCNVEAQVYAWMAPVVPPPFFSDFSKKKRDPYLF